MAESNAICDFIVADSFIDIAAEESPMDSIWFIKVTKIDCVGNGKDVDDYGHIHPNWSRLHDGQLFRKVKPFNKIEPNLHTF